MDRRDFLTGTATLLGALMTASCSTRVPAYRNTSVAGDKGKVFLGMLSEKKEAFLRILDLNDDSYVDFPLPVSPHSFLRSPVSPDEVLVIGFSDSSGVINLSTGETRVSRQPAGSMFNGHGAFASENEIWCTENWVNNQVIARPRSTRDFSYLKDEDVFFEAGHHIVRLPGTTVLVSGGVVHKTRERFVTFYDFAKNEVVRKISTPYVPVHLTPYSSTEVVVVTNDPVIREQGESKRQTMIMGHAMDLSRPTPILTFNINGETKVHWDEGRKDLFKFGLGIRKIPDGRVLTGHTWSSSVICWNNNQIEKVISVPHPQAFTVTKDESQVIIHCSEGLRVYSLKEMELLRTIRFKQELISISTYS